MLELQALAKRYGQVRALDDCTWEAHRGRLLGLLGPNGAGKTTSMRIIFGLVEPDSGEVRWDGGAVGIAERRRFGYMPEQRGLYAKMRIGDQLTYFGQLHGLSARSAFDASHHWLARLGLEGREQSRLEELSHGNQQRVQLAAALLHNPELIVLDEPFSGLDPVAVESLKEMVRDAAAGGAAVVFSSHQLELVEDLCEDIAIINHGRVVTAGELDTIRQKMPVRYVDIGMPGGDVTWAAAIEGAEVVEQRPGRVRLRVPRGTELAPVVAAAQRAGSVEYFRFEPPALSDLFLEAVRGSA
ncbi:MAG TPA: ATP-binding cassette domain-containing protein [Tepidiformaceae bacterium]|nr:ATP-binding cassette domain-containing protein [Tepidiformaceae bacterium]